VRHSRIGTVAVLIASTVAVAQTRAPTLGQAAATAQVIAYGQVEKLERRAGRSIATLRVEYLARGEPASWLTFLAEPIGQYQPSARIGEHLLAFLIPSGELDPPMKLSFGGTAVLPAYNLRGKQFVATMQHGDGLRLPKSLCDSTVKRGTYDCLATLGAVLKAAQLAPLPPTQRGDATFRLELTHCEPCQLASWLERSTTNPTDCGTGTTRGPTSTVRHCVQGALDAGKPFRVLLPKPGIDSEIVDAVASDGRQVYWLHFDSSIEGGGGCSALVSRASCGSLELQDAGPEWLKCRDPHDGEILCSQYDFRVETLTPAKSVSELRCGYDNGGEFTACHFGPAGAETGKVRPPPRGPDLICDLWPDSDEAECRAE
jgi:hypothetical protein